MIQFDGDRRKIGQMQQEYNAPGTTAQRKQELGSMAQGIRDARGWQPQDLRGFAESGLKTYGGASVPDTTMNKAPVMDIKQMADMFGITYDPTSIESKFNQATQAQFNTLRNEYDQTANQFYDRLYDTQNTAMGAMRQNVASSIATGASRGVQAANALAASLGLGQEAMKESTLLAQERAKLVDREAEAYMQNAVDAFTQAEKTKQAVANIATLFDANNVQLSAAQMDMLSRVFSDIQQTESYKYGADKSLEGSIYNTDAVERSSKHNTDVNAGVSRANIAMQREMQGEANAIQKEVVANQKAAQKAAQQAGPGDTTFESMIARLVADPTPANKALYDIYVVPILGKEGSDASWEAQVNANKPVGADAPTTSLLPKLTDEQQQKLDNSKTPEEKQKILMDVWSKSTRSKGTTKVGGR